DSLPVNLDHGPTPDSPSFTIKRIPLYIVSVSAGSNAEKAKLSYDDNEMTDWYNDGNLSSAWIDYELENESPVSQVVLKLNKFRTQSYPLRIFVDNQKVFEGQTPRSLGYVTLTFKPTVGKHVKIELMGDASKKENTSEEVNGKSLDDGVKRADSGKKGRLSIIEAEIYKKPDHQN
ncbi:MAG TPA: discoidin domain-containing protein, partial [Sunxiuqinia sp.]|nr:discoidin domain-containing protein [Sunxiuqinia sp.]